MGSLFTAPVFSQDEKGDELFAFPPRSPERLIRAAVLANQLDRPVLAKKYLATFLETLPGRDALNALRKNVGISVFLKLSSTMRLHPESQQVLAAINAAYPYPQLSPSAIAGLVESLGQSPEMTTSASLQILSAGSDAVVPLLNATPDSESSDIAHQLLSRYAERFEGGLVDTLATSVPRQQTRILGYLGDTGNRAHCFEILPLQFSQEDSVAGAARKALKDISAAEYIRITQPEAAQLLTKQSLLLLKEAGQKQTDVLLLEETSSDAATANRAGQSEPSAQLQTALHLATQAISLNDSTETQGVKHAIEAALNAWPAQWTASTPTQAGSSTSSQDIRMIAEAVKTGLQSNCTACLLELLKNTQRTSEIFDAAPVLKNQCLMNQDPRVRLLAAAALWSEDNRSARVRGIIQSAINGSKQPQAVVIDPRVQDGSDAVRVLRELGYDVEFERTGRQGFSTAAEQLHCELVFVHSNCLQWPLSVTLSNLRSDYRTADVPIVIYGPAEHRKNVAYRVSGDENLWFESEPLGDQTTSRSMELQNVPPPRLTEAERIAMIRFALQLANDN